MSRMREIITELNVANSNDVSEDKHYELKGIIQELLIYAMIEEQIGIDFITLTKALENGICFWPCSDNNLRPCGPFELGLDFKNLRFYSCGDGWEASYYFKDYGKTWALTQEELENEA